MKTFLCSVVGISGKRFQGDLRMLQARGSGGDLGILPGHEPFLTILKPGPMILSHPDGREEVFYVSGGYLEILPEQVIVLADEVFHSEELDENEIIKAKEEMEATLSSNKQSHQDYAVVIAQMAAQLRTIALYRKRH